MLHLLILVFLISIIVNSYQQDFNKIIYSNTKINYINIKKESEDWMILDKKATQIEYKSINYSNFAFFITIKSTNQKLTNKEKNGLTIFLIYDKELSNTTISNNSTYYTTEDIFNGYKFSFNDDKIICTKTTISSFKWDNNEREDPKEYEYKNITPSIYEKGVSLRISNYNNTTYFEIFNLSKNDYNNWFAENLNINKENTEFNNYKFRVKIISNLYGEEEASFQIGNIYFAEFNWLNKESSLDNFNKNNNQISNKSSNDTDISQNNPINNNEIDTKELSDLYDKLYSINNLINNTLSGYEKLLNEFEAYSYESLIEENNKKIKQISYLTNLLNNSTLLNNDSNNKTNKNDEEINKLFNLIRNVSIEKEYSEEKYMKEQEDLINKINDLDKRQQEINQTIISLYTIITNSMNEISLSSNSLENYNFIKKIIFFISLIILIFLLYLLFYVNNITKKNKINKPKQNVDNSDLDNIKPDKLEII